MAPGSHKNNTEFPPSILLGAATIILDARPLVVCAAEIRGSKLVQLTFGVWDLTLPARASEPWTLPMMCDRFVNRRDATVQATKIPEVSQVGLLKDLEYKRVWTALTCGKSAPWATLFEQSPSRELRVQLTVCFGCVDDLVFWCRWSRWWSFRWWTKFFGGSERQDRIFPLRVVALTSFYGCYRGRSFDKVT